METERGSLANNLLPHVEIPKSDLSPLPLQPPPPAPPPLFLLILFGKKYYCSPASLTLPVFMILNVFPNSLKQPFLQHFKHIPMSTREFCIQVTSWKGWWGQDLKGRIFMFCESLSDCDLQQKYGLRDCVNQYNPVIFCSGSRFTT